MKLFLTIVLSVLAYLGMAYYGMASLIIWIMLIVLWAIVDYCTYKKPFNWKDYTLLVIVLSLVEIGAWYDYFGML